MSLSPRANRWIETSRGYVLANGTVAAHEHFDASRLQPLLITRERRETFEREYLSKGATLSYGAGDRRIPEKPDPLRTAFERDRDRIVHSTSFRRLAGKTQVFIFPTDHQRTRLTHALEVAQVATAVSRAIGLNVALTEAIAFGHDCGHGPGGHASEDAFSKFLPAGFDHATWGADHTLVDLNLCSETLDGIRNHSWSRPQPRTPEGTVVSFADRIAYCAHDLEDAIRAGIVRSDGLPLAVVEVAGGSRDQQLSYFILDLVETAVRTGQVALSELAADSLAELREFNYKSIYMRPESVEQSHSVIRVLSLLVEYYVENPDENPIFPGIGSDDVQPGRIDAAVGYVSGMTDRFAFWKANEKLGLSLEALPLGIDVSQIAWSRR